MMNLWKNMSEKNFTKGAHEMVKLCNKKLVIKIKNKVKWNKLLNLIIQLTLNIKRSTRKKKLKKEEEKMKMWINFIIRINWNTWWNFKINLMMFDFGKKRRLLEKEAYDLANFYYEN